MAASGAPVLAFRIAVRPPLARVVLDTNLFVAAYWSPRSASARILRACEEDQLELLVSPAVRRELFRILRNARTDSAHQQRAAELLEWAEEVHPTRKLHLVVEDPEDDKFLECALDGHADYVITSDGHLLRLGSVDGVCIVKPTAFVRDHLGGGAPRRC